MIDFPLYKDACGCQVQLIGIKQQLFSDGSEPINQPIYSECGKKDENRPSLSREKPKCEPRLIGYRQTLFSDGAEPKTEPFYTTEFCQKEDSRGQDNKRTGIEFCKKQIIGYRQTIFAGGLQAPKIEPIYQDCTTKGPTGRKGLQGLSAGENCASNGRSGAKGRNL